ncbi:MAG: hypothetical protein M1834_007961 [Cirrosporium novae-zelandiae]|nr:MAG: hypothetical protein M1834_007961 [Cirrosporium novae-zelandiae]
MGSEIDKEAYGASHIENISPGNDTDVDVDSQYSYKEQRSIIHRIDRRLVTICGLMYCISLMDRTNLSAAAIAGMEEELELTVGFRYGFGFVQNWQTMAALRSILGVLEAGFFPGTVYLLSTWYSRYDMQKRYSGFYIIGCLASACSGILAFGLMQMDGLQNLAGWRWIFIMEGVITCLVSLIGFILLIDFPEKSHNHIHFLSHAEIAYVLRRINKDRNDAVTPPFSLKQFLLPCLDPKIWGFALIFFSVTTVTYAIAYFLPIILLSGMGFGIGASQCLVTPPYAFAAILMYLTSWFGDKYHTRAPVICFNATIALIGLPIMGFADGNAARYFGVFLVTAGANGNIPAAMTYQANNIRGHWKRAFCSASLVGFGGIGGIAGSLVFRSQDAPEYYPGIYAAIA